MKKLLIITPHLSTGGAPQVTLNKLQLIKDEFEIMLVEHAFISWEYVVQRNKIISLIGLDRFVSLGENKTQEIKSIIEYFQPDVVSMEEVPELFMESEMANYIYRNDRTYAITETTHDSSFNVKHKRFFPDKFIFVSPYSALQYIDFNVPYEVIEYPVDSKKSNKFEKRELLGLEHDYKHVIIVGLFTPRKNQKYAFELAEKLYPYKIKLHFLGNQAGNFESYWKPLMDRKKQIKELSNAIVWGERSDIVDFVEASDAFLFCSKGERTNKELNPIAIKEAMEYDIPKFMYNLDVYLNKYNSNQFVHYLNGDVEHDIKLIVDHLGLKQHNNKEELIVIGTYPNLKERVRLTKECITRLYPLERDIMLVSHYPVDSETQKLCQYYIYDSHNPLTHHSYYDRFYNYTDNYDALIYINALRGSNQSLTVLTNLFNAFKDAKARGYKKVFYTTFDVLVDDRDFQTINDSFSFIDEGKKAFLATLNTPFGKGIQTNGMTFDVDYFLNTFHDVRNPLEYNTICSEIGSQNFLEDYMIKVLNQMNQENIMYIHNDKETFLLNSGLGVSSNSEYYSIIPIENETNKFMFYFYSYNLDDRKLELKIKEDDKVDITYFDIKNREFKKEISFNGTPISIDISFFDGDNQYKSENHVITNNTLSLYKSTGSFKWKNKKYKIKLVHIQTTLNDEREQASRNSLESVKEFGMDYVLHTNVPYGDLPPKHNCIRPDCVSIELFDEERIQKYGTALTPAHYGCYDAFRTAILSEFTNDIDFLIVCEGDCIIEVPTKQFVEIVQRCAQTMIENNVGYMSFGDKDTLEFGWKQSNVIEEIPNQDLMFITNHIIGLQCIMFPKFASSYLKEQLRTHKWDASDMYFNIIMGASPFKMGILYDRITTQADGFSLIDNTEKVFRKK